MSGWLEENIFLQAERFHAQEKPGARARRRRAEAMRPRPPSEARLRAQRANARRSTGPRSAKGKRRSAMNGLKFGSFEGFLRTNGYPVDDLRRIWRDLAAIFWFVDPVDRYGSLEWCALRWWSKLQLLRGEPIKTNRNPAGAAESQTSQTRAGQDLPLQTPPVDALSDRNDRSEADYSDQLRVLDSAIENYLGDLVTRYASASIAIGSGGCSSKSDRAF